MKLGIQPLLPIGNFLNKRYSIEMDFPDDSNPAENFKHLNEIIIAVHMSEYPMCYKEGKPLFSSYQGDEETGKVVKVDKVPDEIQAILDGINNSPDMKELGSYWLRSKGNLILSSAYKAKEKQLTDAK